MGAAELRADEHFGVAGPVVGVPQTDLQLPRPCSLTPDFQVAREPVHWAEEEACEDLEGKWPRVLQRQMA